MHLERDLLDRMSHGDVEPAEWMAAERHLSSCEACRERFEDARLCSLLEALDDPVPEIAVEEIIARAEQRLPRIGRWAATIALTFGAAGALYAIPGSPVPAWIGGVVAAVSSGDAQASSGVADMSGVVVPVGARLVIELESQAAGTIVFRLVDGSEVAVEALNAPATFDSRAELLVVASPAMPDYRIAIPSGAPNLEVRVGDLSILTLTAGELQTRARPSGSDSYSIDFRDIY